MGLRGILIASLAALAFVGTVPASAAASTKLLLTGNGKALPSGDGTRWEYEAQLPGFKCFGGHQTTLEANPSRTLGFVTGPGGGEAPAFSSCAFPSGAETEPGEELESKLKRVIVSAGTVSEYFYSESSFVDVETGCVWTLLQLSGPLPDSGSLENVAVSGVARLRRRLSRRVRCARRASVSGVLSLRTGEASSSKPPYLVETID